MQILNILLYIKSKHVKSRIHDKWLGKLLFCQDNVSRPTLFLQENGMVQVRHSGAGAGIELREGRIWSKRRGTQARYIMYVILRILYAASIDVNDTSLYILFASASSGDRKHANTCVLEYNGQIIIPCICKADVDYTVPAMRQNVS